MPPENNIPQDLSDKTKSISTIKALSSQLKNKIDNRSQKEASKQTDEISANSLSDSQEYNSIVETFNESNKIIKPETDISYLRKQTHRCVDNLQSKRRLNSRKMERLMEHTKTKSKFYKKFNQSLPDLELPKYSKSSKKFKENDFSSSNFKVESTFDNRATNESNESKLESETQNLILRFSTFVKDDSKLSKTQHHQQFNNYLKDHLKYKITTDFYLNNMKDRINILENTIKFKKDKSKKLLKKFDKKALQIASTRLRAKSLVIEKSSPGCNPKSSYYQKINSRTYCKKPKTHRMSQRSKINDSSHKIRPTKTPLIQLKNSKSKSTVPTSKASPTPRRTIMFSSFQNSSSCPYTLPQNPSYSKPSSRHR
ncbi:unnamed protein product [Moneuplotes crassus]|uniref:Uncharacterized protein n=1 Tax=Euplotes crassus TaxID=5936 RepID=A0AAD1X5J1_EUPCR|nr:unnamed protein product [Moneuplotes crassus]